MQAVIGVDPHKQVFSAVALDERGGVIGRWQGSTNRQGVKALQRWGADCAPGATWAIEGANSLGRNLALALSGVGVDVRDVYPTRTANAVVSRRLTSNDLAEPNHTLTAIGLTSIMDRA